MTEGTIDIFFNDIYSKPPKKDYATNETDVYHIVDIWNLHILDLKDYGPENIRGYRYVLVVSKSISMFGSTVTLKKCSDNKRFFQEYSKMLKKTKLNWN